MGGKEKKYKVRGKLLNFKEISLLTDPDMLPVIQFLKKFEAPSPHFEVHTSGSTGAPKTISLQKAHMRISARKTLDFLNINKGDKVLLCISPAHIGGVMILVRWLEGELDLYPQLPGSNPLKGLQVKVDFAAMVPLQVYHSLPYLHKVRIIIVGGGIIPPDLEKELEKKDSIIWHSYGMTETISHVAMRQVNGGGLSQNQYQALPGVYFSVDERECLVINAPDIDVCDLHTNDVVKLRPGNKFIWKGRYDHVVNSGGIKLFPEEIEKKIGEIGYPYFIAGIPDEKLGEKLIMVVEASQQPDVEQHFKKLEKYERPKQVMICNSILRTGMGKFRRKETLHTILKY